MKIFLYTSTTGHSIVSPINLDYARNGQNTIDLNEIREADFRMIQLLTDLNIAKCVKSLLESDSWPAPESVIDHADKPSSNWEHDICVSRNGITYIRNGKDYEPIEQFIESSDKETLVIALKLLSTQAAQCYTTIAMLMSKNKGEAE